MMKADDEFFETISLGEMLSALYDGEADEAMMHSILEALHQNPESVCRQWSMFSRISDHLSTIHAEQVILELAIKCGYPVSPSVGWDDYETQCATHQTGQEFLQRFRHLCDESNNLNDSKEFSHSNNANDLDDSNESTSSVVSVSHTRHMRRARRWHQAMEMMPMKHPVHPTPPTMPIKFWQSRWGTLAGVVMVAAVAWPMMQWGGHQTQSISVASTTKSSVETVATTEMNQNVTVLKVNMKTP